MPATDQDQLPRGCFDQVNEFHHELCHSGNSGYSYYGHHELVTGSTLCRLKQTSGQS